MSIEMDARKDFWKSALEQQENSGLSIPTFCKANGKSKSQFYYWKRRFGASRSPAIKKAKEINFLELKSMSSEIHSHANAPVEIRIGRCSLLYSHDTDRDLFKAAVTFLLEVLG